MDVAQFQNHFSMPTYLVNSGASRRKNSLVPYLFMGNGGVTVPLPSQAGVDRPRCLALRRAARWFFTMLLSFPPLDGEPGHFYNVPMPQQAQKKSNTTIASSSSNNNTAGSSEECQPPKDGATAELNERQIGIVTFLISRLVSACQVIPSCDSVSWPFFWFVVSGDKTLPVVRSS